MTYVLNARERKLLEYLQLDHRSFQIPGQLPTGTGKVTLDRMVELDLLETGPGRHGTAGYRITDNGWRCMYNMTHEEMISAGGTYHPLRVWSWPPTA